MSVFSRSGLTTFLIAKSILEALLVAGLATAFYFSIANSQLDGQLNHADWQTIVGWAVDEANPGRRVEVQLFIDGRFVEQRAADDFRPDVHQAGHAADDWHGFVFKTPELSPGSHEAQVYFVRPGASPSRRTLQMIGNTLRFTVSSASTQ